MNRILVALTGLTLALGACGGSSSRPAPRDTVSSGDTFTASDVTVQDTTATDTRPVPLDTTGTDTATADTGGTTTGCDYNGWTPNGSTSGQITAGAEEGTWESLFIDSYSDDVEIPFDLLGLEMYFEYGADDGPHTHTFTGENYADCGECLLIYAGCDESFECSRTFLAKSGTLQVTENGGSGGNFAGTLSNVVLEEVTINETTWQSTVVSGGQRWCVPSFSFQTFIDLYTPE
ncbi:MAG: hypothetical protein EP329_28170 [Deltaproteobacteria bacterium]|nr:MAG: hypothetical protein EP329_28170 [Deltaproteobacteria bacterium]